MALKSTIYKIRLDIVDIDRNYYQEHKLPLACHPSETAERLMIRILAFALNAHERLEAGGGISESEQERVGHQMQEIVRVRRRVY